MTGDEPARPTGVPRLWDRQFISLFTGQSISALGNFVAFVALPLYMAFLTGSPLALGLTLAAETLPVLFLGIAGGVFLDRWRLRRTLIASDVVRGTAFGLLALAAGAGVGRWWMVIGAALVVGTMAVLFDSGLRALVPSIVRDEVLVTANSRLQLARTIALTAGPALGGVLVGAGSYSLAFAFDAATFVTSAVLLLAVRPAGRPTAERKGFRAELREGITHLLRDPLMRWATVGAAGANLLIAPLEATLVLFAADDLGLSEERIGLTFAIGGVCAVLAALGAARVVSGLGLGRSIIVSLALLGVGLVVIARANGFASVAAGTALAMAMVVWINVAGDTMWQQRTPPELRGRVIAASRTLASALLPLGAAAGGILGEWLGLAALYAGAAVALLALAGSLGLTPLWKAGPLIEEAHGQAG